MQRCGRDYGDLTDVDNEVSAPTTAKINTTCTPTKPVLSTLTGRDGSATERNGCASEGLVTASWATVIAIERAVHITVLIQDSTATYPKRAFEVIVWTLVNAVEHAIIVRVDGFTPTHRHSCYVRFIGALVEAVWSTVTITVNVRRATSTYAKENLVCIRWALVKTICYSIAISVNVCNATATQPKRRLEGVVGALINTISRTIGIRVCLCHPCAERLHCWRQAIQVRHRAATRTFDDSVRIVWAFVCAVQSPVPI
jgi:hypothetical protein